MTMSGLASLRVERGERLVERLLKLRRLPGEEAEASLCVGQPSNFNLPQHQPSTPTVTWPNDDRPEEEEDTGQPRYKELSAVVREVRVTNPEDDEQYVDLLARNASLLRRPNGEEFWIDWLQDLTEQPKAT